MNAIYTSKEGINFGAMMLTFGDHSFICEAITVTSEGLGRFKLDAVCQLPDIESAKHFTFGGEMPPCKAVSESVRRALRLTAIGILTPCGAYHTINLHFESE